MVTSVEIPILYSDDFLLVLDKPFGVVVNRSHTYKGITVQDYLESTDLIKLDSSSTGNLKDADFAGTEFRNRTGVVHRLDKDTSGVLVVARDVDSFKRLLSQFKNREITKEYIAVVLGEVVDEIVEINAPIKRNPDVPLRFAIVEGGRDALTRAEKLVTREVKDGSQEISFTKLCVKPETGRTHQIRVHMAAFGHPVCGDVIYCTKKQLELTERFYDRLMLHAHKITICHPDNGKDMTFESKIPQSFTF